LLTGSCVVLDQLPSYINQEPRYPGEVCDEMEEDFICVKGYKKCFRGRCMGFGRGDPCTKTEDCELGFYCKYKDNLRQCQLFEIENATCITHDACGR